MLLCLFGRYRYVRLPFGAAPSGDMFKKKTDELLSGVPNVIGLADDILMAGFEKDGRDHNKGTTDLQTVKSKT